MTTPLAGMSRPLPKFLSVVERVWPKLALAFPFTRRIFARLRLSLLLLSVGLLVGAGSGSAVYLWKIDSLQLRLDQMAEVVVLRQLSGAEAWPEDGSAQAALADGLRLISVSRSWSGAPGAASGSVGLAGFDGAGRHVYAAFSEPLAGAPMVVTLDAAEAWSAVVFQSVIAAAALTLLVFLSVGGAMLAKVSGRGRAEVASRAEALTQATLAPLSSADPVVEGVRPVADGVRDLGEAERNLIARLTDEMRAPLNAVVGFAELMQRRNLGPLGNPGYGDYVSHILDSGRHLSGLLDDIADYQDTEAGRIRLDEGIVDVESLVEFAVGVLEIKARRHRIRLTTAARGLPPLRGDARRLRQILLNMLNHCLEGARDGGEVILKARLLNRGDLSVTVCDDGPARSQTEIARMLSPFHGEEVSTDEADRANLGLPLAKNLIELHGGGLTVTSSATQGNRLTATFPFGRVVWMEGSTIQAMMPDAKSIYGPAKGSC